MIDKQRDLYTRELFMVSMAFLMHNELLRHEEMAKKKAKKKEEELEDKVYITISLLACLAVSFLPLIAILYGKDALMMALAIIAPSTVSLYYIAYFLLRFFHHDD